MRKLIRFLTGLACLLVLPALGYAQGTPITGTITDAGGAPIAGASIIIKSTSRGTSSDAEGKFKLSVSPGAVLIISSTGFSNQNVPVTAGTSDLTIKLQEDVTHLD